MKLCGAIMAAGRGSRIRPLSFRYPKPMLPVGNKPIMEHQIEYMKDLGIKEIYIVVGHLRQHIESYFGDGSKWGVRITYVEQAEPKGIAHAVSMLEGLVKEPVLVFLGDIFIMPKNLGLMAELFGKSGAEKCGAVLAVLKEKNIEMVKRNFSVEHDEKGRVKRVVEKPQNPPNSLKGCGIYLFSPKIFDAIRETPASSLRNEVEITDAIQVLISKGHDVYSAEVVDWDMNVTFPEDLLNCNMKYLDHQKKDVIIGEGAIIPGGAVIKHSIIGPNASITETKHIENSVIFPGVRLSLNLDITNALISEHSIHYF